MKIIGLTGGIASGKSTISKLLKEKYHLPVIDADFLAREVVLPGSDGLLGIKKEFGAEFIKEDGCLDRKLMGALISKDTAQREKLNAILHPAIGALYHEALKGYGEQGCPVVIYDCPLLIEANQTKEVHEIVLVVADAETRLRRVMARDGVDEALARKKIGIQMCDEEKMAVSHGILYNNGSFNDLEEMLDFFVKEKLKNTCIIGEERL